MTGIEGPAAGVGARLAGKVVQEFFKTTEFERLCSRLATRFSDRLPYTSADFALWSRDDAFSTALSKYMAPPHEFDRDALVAAIVPLVGDLDQDTSAEKLAVMIADVIGEELRLAKSGDALVRFEADRLAEVFRADASESRAGGAKVLAPGGGLFWTQVDFLTPTDFGVTPLDPSFGSRFTWGPRFPRVIDSEVEEALATGLSRGSPCMIVLVGPSGAGKSRAVHDALQQHCPTAQIVIPENANSLGHTLDRGDLMSEIPADGRILLLDDLELFVAPDGLTAKRLAALKRERGPLVLVATAGGKGPRLLGESEREVRGSHLSDLLALWDHAIRVDVQLTEWEIARSRMLPRDMERLRQHGLVWLTGAPRLLEKLRTGCHDPAAVPNRAGQLLTELVLEWHSYGLPAGIPEPSLRRLLLEREPSLSEQDVDGALRWALRPVAGEISLLRQVHDAEQVHLEANDFLRRKEVWFHDDDFNLNQWRQVTRFSTALQRLELLNRQRPAIAPDQVDLDKLQEELNSDGADVRLLAQVEAVRMAMCDEMLTSLWETAPEWPAEEANDKFKLIDEYSGSYLEAIELAAAGDHAEGLYELARLCVPAGSREQEHYYRRALDEAVKAGASVSELVDPLVGVARAQHARGELAAMAETCEAVMAVRDHPESAEWAVKTCWVLLAIARGGENVDLGSLQSYAAREADWEQLATHFLELNRPELAIRLAHGDVDLHNPEARALVQMGQFDRATKILTEAKTTVNDQCLLADILSLTGHFADQLVTLQRAFATAESDVPSYEKGHRYGWEDRAALTAREVDAGLLIEVFRGAESAEVFYRERIDSNPCLAAFLADLLIREGRPKEGMSLLHAHTVIPCLWGRQMALNWRRLDSPSASVAPWDHRFVRVEVPGYREATRRIAAHAERRNEAVAIAMLLCDACIHERWDESTVLVEKAVAVPPEPVRSVVDQAVLGIEFDPATEYFWRAGILLQEAARMDAAKAVWELCRRDGLSEAMVELGLAAQDQDPPKALGYFKEAAARFHPDASRVAENMVKGFSQTEHRAWPACDA